MRKDADFRHEFHSKFFCLKNSGRVNIPLQTCECVDHSYQGMKEQRYGTVGEQQDVLSPALSAHHFREKSRKREHRHSKTR